MIFDTPLLSRQIGAHCMFKPQQAAVQRFKRNQCQVKQVKPQPHWHSKGVERRPLGAMLDNAVYSGRMGADLDRAYDWELESVFSLSPAIHALVKQRQSQPL